MRIFLLVTLVVVCFATAVSQQVTSQQRSQAIAAEFTKHKELSKEKYGVRKVKYKDVRSEPAIKQNAREYAGVYEVSDLGEMLSLQVDSNGRIQGNGYERQGEQTRTFNLQNARIEGALLTATKVYDNGTSERFEGAFLIRTDRESPTDPGVQMFGLGVVLSTPRQINGNAYDKLFYQRK